MKEPKFLIKLRGGEALSRKEQVEAVLQLSWPAIIAQLASVLMQYIDASMVGSLGEEASAAIGLMSSSCWLFNGTCEAFTVGFTILIAQFIGAGDEKLARKTLKTALISSLVFTFAVMTLGIAIHSRLPYWLGGNPSIASEGANYFLIILFMLPFSATGFLCASSLQACGNMKVPSRLYALMCLFDVIFNALFIYDELNLFGLHIKCAGLGVTGAAVGTALAQFVTTILVVYFCIFRAPQLRPRKDERGQKYNFNLAKRAVKMSVPICFERMVMSGAQMAMTSIVAPLGNVSIAAHSFAITVESLCYMPGTGVQEASSTIIGQSVGARRNDLTTELGWICTFTGMAIMTISGTLMYIFATPMMKLLSPVPAIVALGAQMLRIEAFAEPLYAASIACMGVFRGAGDTLLPSLFNFASMWIVRIPMAAVLAKSFGLKGVWIAMCIELCVRGTIFLIYEKTRRWQKY